MKLETYSPVDIIIQGGMAWTSAATLHKAGCSAALLETLESAGILERWNRPDGEFWTLTPLTAAREHVEIDEVFSCSGQTVEEIPIWVAEGKAGLTTQLPRRARLYSLPFPELVEDKGPPPDEEIEPCSCEPVTLWGLEILVSLRDVG